MAVQPGRENLGEFTWLVSQWSKAPCSLLSHEFQACGVPWKLKCFPHGPEEESRQVSLFLVSVHPDRHLPGGCSAKFKLAIMNQADASKSVIKEAEHSFLAKDEDWGFKAFMPQQQMSTKRFCKDDVVIIKAIIKVDGCWDRGMLSPAWCQDCTARNLALNQLKPEDKSIQQQLNQTLILLQEEKSKRRDEHAQHEAAAAHWETLLEKRNADSDSFDYRIRGSQDTGSVPRLLFAAEPDSALARMYNGQWEYARDDTGRANVNSCPAHWEMILNWLSFGAVPSQPSKEFIAECQYWQLQRLLAALEPTGSRWDRFGRC